MYLVTGGSGYCGLEIARVLAAEGERVRVLDLEPMPEALSGVEFERGDVRDAAAVKRAMRGVARVVHAAAKVPVSKAGREFFEVNAGGTRAVLEAALEAKVVKVVHLSSSAVQAPSGAGPVGEDAPARPVGAYARSKAAAERACFEYARRGLAVDVVRPRTVVGRGRLGIFGVLFEWLSEDRRLYVIGGGRNRIQLLDAGDLARFCLLASRSAASETYNVGGARFSALREDLEALVAHAGSKSRVTPLPVAPSIAALAALDVLRLSPLASWHYLTYHRDFYFSNEKAKRLLGWEPRLGNRDVLFEAYDAWAASKRDGTLPGSGATHRRPARQGLLGLLRKIS